MHYLLLLLYSDFKILTLLNQILILLDQLKLLLLFLIEQAFIIDNLRGQIDKLIFELTELLFFLFL